MLFQFKKEEGFTTMELILAIVVTTLTSIVFFMLIGDTIKVNQLTQETHFAEDLISDYVNYYENTEITEENFDSFFTLSNRVDLVQKVNEHINNNPSDGNIPDHFKNLNVWCEVTPSLVGNDKFIQFVIECKIDDRPINKDNPYIVKRFISKF